MSLKLCRIEGVDSKSVVIMSDRTGCQAHMGASEEYPHRGTNQGSDYEGNYETIRHGDDADRQAFANIGSVDRSHIDADSKYERNLKHHGDAEEEGEALQGI